MAFTDPLTVTIDSTPYTLARTLPEKTRTVYSTQDELIKMIISHQESKDRTRSMVRLDQRVVAANPLTSVNEYKDSGVYVVFDRPEYGFTTTAIDNNAQALFAWLATANVTKVLGNEH